MARGNVVLRQGARTLRADWIAFNRRTGVGVASGNVELREGDEVAARRLRRSSSVETTRQGIVHDGEIDSPAGQFRASRRRDPQDRREHATRSRAPSSPPAAARTKDGATRGGSARGEADLEVGGYGIVRDATFDVLGVPVLWLPWMILPLTTERQTGFLFPEIVGRRAGSGFEIGLAVLLGGARRAST